MTIDTIKSGQVAIGDISADGVVNVDVSKYVYEYDAKMFPFTTLLEAKNKAVPALTKEFNFNILGELNRTYTVAAGSTATTINTANTAGLQVGNQVVVSAGGSAQAGVNFYSARVITAVVPNTSFTINTTFGGTLAANDTVYLISYAAGEGSKSPASVLPSTARGLNYVQQFKRAIEVSNDLRKERKYFNVESLYRMSQLSEYKQDMELAELFGIGQKAAVDAEGKVIYTMQGFWSALQDPTNVTFPFFSANEKQSSAASLVNVANKAALTRSAFNAFLQDAMTYGSAEKILFVNSWLMDVISGFGDQYFRTEKNKKTMLNVEVTEVLVPGKGVVNIVYNPCFEKGMTFKGGILVDPANVRKRVYRPTSLEYSIQENDRDGKKDQILGSYSIEWAKLETHGYITHL